MTIVDTKISARAASRNPGVQSGFVGRTLVDDGDQSHIPVNAQGLQSFSRTMTFSPPSRASYAADPDTGRGRRIAETSSATRTAFQRDRDRIVHSSAFRRLALKTQVFLPEQGDHYRTRLTHTIEVAQIARTIARALGLDDDLTEALALAHDLGHTPFGHTGEDALDAVMQPFGGFDHNAQTLRILTLIERRYPAFDGLNLTWDTLDGLINRGSDPGLRHERRSDWHCQGLACFQHDDAWSRTFTRFPSPSAEAQVAAVADDIAYNAHDLEDGLEAALFALGDLQEIALPAQVKAALLAATPGLADDLLVRGVTRELVGMFVEDAIAESRHRLADARPDCADAVRALPAPVVALSPAMAEASDSLKSFLFAHMYRHPRLVAVRTRARQIVQDLAQKYLADPILLPPEWRAQPDLLADPRHRARRVSDYVAGMTDRFAVADHRRLFDDTPDLR